MEAAVRLVERWILARRRHRRLFGLAQLNAALAEERERLNAPPFKGLPGSRRSLVEEMDRPALQPLPAAFYEYADWTLIRALIDYHV